MAQANKESEEREVRKTREIERFLNDHDKTYAHTMTSLEKRLDTKSDLMMQKLDEILNRSNREERSAPRERSRQANDGDGARSRGPAKFENELRIQAQGVAQGSPIEARLDKPGPVGGGCHPGDKIAHCARSQISARSDYGLTGHNDVCFDV